MKNKNITHLNENKEEILNLIMNLDYKTQNSIHYFGKGDSDDKFLEIILCEEIWDKNIQKKFVDIEI